MTDHLVLCIALFRQQAEDIMHRLELDGISDDHISVVFPEKGALALPGIGSYIAAGPIVPALTAAAPNASREIALGLIGLGVPKDKALRYQRKIEGGRFLLSVQGRSLGEIDRAKGIFTTMGGLDICCPGEQHAVQAI